MFIGHYRAVDKAKEFYSNKRQKLDFPTQVEYKKERYLLVSTYTVSGGSQENNIKNRAIELDIPYDIELD
jgi:hypothetical protein